MNITCSKCLQPFSITASQLGTRGKCPHCRATVILPKSSKAGALYYGDQLEAPDRWSQHLLAGFVALLLHSLLLGTLAVMPWGTILDGKAGDETVVMIGQLPRNIRLKNERDELDPSEIVQPVYDRAMDKFDSELLSPGVDGHLEQLHWQDLSLSASAGGENLFEFLSANDSQSLASGDEDFEKIVSRLNRDGLDIVITFDSTGSMQGEIDQVKGQIQRLGSVLFELIRKTRIGICTYRDGGDAYVVQGHPLTDNLTEIVLYLEKISAAGGGDEPEAVDAGLQWACEQKFRRAARKVVLLFGDAPPRPNRSLVCQKISSDFRKQGGIVSTVTCRNSRRLDDFIKIAQSGGGEAFLTSHEQEIMAQLMVLVFGSQHRAKVIQAFDLLER